MLAREAADPQLALVVARLLDSTSTAAAAAGEAVSGASGVTTWQQQERPAAAARATGGPLQKRLVNEELLLLAEADPDPAAAALASWVSSSDGSSAVGVLLTRLAAGGAGIEALDTESLDAAAAAKPDVQQQQHPQMPQHHQATPVPPAQLPVYMHWILVCGIPQLAGRAVTGSLIPALHRLSIRVARCAEIAGLPWAAAEALAVADAVPDPCSAADGVLTTVLGMMWRARLAAEVLALQLVPSSDAAATAAGAGDYDVAHWEAVVAGRLPVLQKLGLQADTSAVAAALARHAAAVRPVMALPATAPGSSWCVLPSAAGSNQTADVTVSTQASVSVSRRWSATGPDAVLAICLSRTSSSMVCSPAASTTISRTASTAVNAVINSATTPASAAAAAAGHPAATLAAAADSTSRTGAVVSSGGQPAKQQQQGQQVLALSWELARQEGDKLRAVAPCVGTQFACTVLPQHATLQQHLPGSPRQGLSPAGAGRARPLVFASRNAGIISSHLCAPAALMTHVAAAAAAAGNSRPPARQQQPAANGTLPQQRTANHGKGPGQQPGSAAAAGSSGSSLSGFMSQMLDQLRWPPDPWVVGEFPNRRSHSFGSAGMSHVSAAALAAHPSRPLYVSGSSTGRIYLWQFGDVMCKAAYVPMTSSQVRRARLFGGSNCCYTTEISHNRDSFCYSLASGGTMYQLAVEGQLLESSVHALQIEGFQGVYRALYVLCVVRWFCCRGGAVALSLHVDITSAFMAAMFEHRQVSTTCICHPSCSLLMSRLWTRTCCKCTGCWFAPTS